jgi:DNA-binding CsgD family transcriptional regulator
MLGPGGYACRSRRGSALRAASRAKRTTGRHGRVLVWAVCAFLGVALVAIAALVAPGDAVCSALETRDNLPGALSCTRLFVVLCAIKNDVISGAIASTLEAAFAVDRQGEIVAWNLAAEKRFGFEAKDALGRHCWNLLAGQDVFENRYCCEGCPIRGAAFSHEPIRDNQLKLQTAQRYRQKFDVCMLLVPDGHGNETLVHLCRPARQAAEAREDGDPHRPGRASSGRRALTNREIEVLALLSRGMETGEVASQLCISEATVRNHVQHILGKLSVHGRIAALAKARKLGLI